MKGQAEDYQYLEMFLRLWPKGAFHQAVTAPGRVFHAILYGISKSAAQLHNDRLRAIDEVHPQSADETLDMWENMVGFPDAMFDMKTIINEMTDEDAIAKLRQSMLVTKFTACSSNSPYGWSELIKKIDRDGELGIQIEFNIPYKYAGICDYTVCGDPLEGDYGSFVVHVDGTCPDEYKDHVEKMLLVYTPPHIVFEYPGEEP